MEKQNKKTPLGCIIIPLVLIVIFFVFLNTSFDSRFMTLLQGGSWSMFVGIIVMAICLALFVAFNDKL